MKNLEEVNKEIKRMEELASNGERTREYRKSNPEKVKESQDKWNKKNRKEYQRNYRKLKNKQL